MDTQAVARQRAMRREAAWRDVEILTRLGPDDDLDELVTWTSEHIDSCLEVDR